MKVGSHHTPESLELMSANRKGRGCGANNGMNRPHVKERHRAAVKAVWDSRKANYKDPKWLFDQYITQRKTTVQIAQEQGVNHVTIWNWLIKHGIEVRGNSPADLKYKDRDWLFKQYVTKRKTTYEIAKLLGVNQMTIWKWLRKFGIETRKTSDWVSGDKNPMKRPEVVEKISGPSSYNWNGGSSMAPYCEKWTPNLRKRIRAFFDYECILCGKSTEDNGEPLCCHHGYYNKETCCDDSTPIFAVLCRSCHNRTTAGDRNQWTHLLSDIIHERYGGKSYFTKEEFKKYKLG